MPHAFVSFKNRMKMPKKPLFRKILKLLIYATIIGVVFVVGLFAYFYKDLPSPGKVNERFVVESTKIFDRTGQHLLYEIHGEEKRTLIPFSEMPDSVKYATIALEDKDFYTHSGIKFISIARAALADIFQGSAAQGGSTITQQFVKNSILTREKTFTRKIKEVILSIELEQKFTKNAILEMYLNEIPYGSNAYGVEAAAQTYFGKNAKDLTLDESALLAVLPKAPTYYSPYGSNLEDLKARQEMALKKMSEQGYITEQQYKDAASVDILSKISPFREKIDAPHFVMYVKEYLEKKYGRQATEEEGLRVYTTLDWDKQQVAEKAVKEGADSNMKKYWATNASLVAMDPKTGQILAMVGSKDYFDKTIDGQVNVSTRDRQPGSSFKPYVYLTAFEKGYTPETILWDVSTNFSTDSGKDYKPQDYDGKNRGPVQMKNSLAMSLNIPAVETLYLAGVKESIGMARRLGITTLQDPTRLGLSLVLGGGEVKLLDHVNAFGTLATGGIKHNKTAILKIETNQGDVLEEYKQTSGDRAVDEKHVAALDYILSTNDLRAPIFGTNNPLRFDNRPVAAKTGTTNEWRDGWTIGYTPSLVVGVWAGNNDNAIMKPGADGSFVAAPIWRAFMDQALKNMPVEKFPKYEKEITGKAVLDGTLSVDEEIKVCKMDNDKYCLANDTCPDDKEKKRKFAGGHSILWYVNKDDPRGDIPKNPEIDPQFNAWEKAVRNWLEDQKDFADQEMPDRECKKSDF